MKRFLWVLFVPFALISCKEDEAPIAAYKTGDQLLINPNFESQTTAAQGWFFLKTGGDYLGNLNSDEFYSPSRSVAIINESPVENNFAYWSQSYTMETPAAKALEFSAYIKGKDIEGDGIAIALGTYDDQNSPNAIQFVSSQSNRLIKGTFDWTKYSVELNNIRPETKRITVFLIMIPKTKGEVYFDDAFLRVK
ncbi:hypothetical protein EF405_16670 [Cyclobacteriaceae bacterium YHN15]|nr:hypothetical protein EF405_16670 [Cyclobacteriaceae bacterium YHN15]